jgi:hypothetical protein
VILGAALGMLIEWSHDIPALSQLILPSVLWIGAVLFAYAHDKLITKWEEELFINRLKKHYVWVFIVLLICLWILLLWWAVLHNLIANHASFLYTLLIIIYALILELIALSWGWRKLFSFWKKK